MLRAVRRDDPGRYVHVKPGRYMSISEGVGKFILGARHQLTANCSAGQQKLDSLREAGFSLAIGTPNRRNLGGKVQGLLCGSVRAKASD